MVRRGSRAIACSRIDDFERSPMNRWKLAALGLGVMALVGFVIARRTSEASSSAHRERDSAEDLSRQVEALRREVGELRANNPARVYVVTQPAPAHFKRAFFTITTARRRRSRPRSTCCASTTRLAMSRTRVRASGPPL